MKRYLILILIFLGIVAYMSSMPYEDQSIIPELRTILADRPFEEQLSSIHLTYWGSEVSVDENGYFHFVEFLIRKSIHFFGYGILGVLIFLFYRKMSWQLPSLFAILSIFIIASLDELRQRMSPGRTGIFQDVVLDTVGAITCILLMKLILGLFSSTNKIFTRKNAGI